VAIGVLVAFHLGGEILPFDVNGRSVAVLGTTSIVGVLYAYLVRFVPLTTLTLDASLDKVKPSVVMAARTLGARPGRVLARVYAPMLRSGAAAALLLVFVHTMQELSIVLLLRPFDYETLSVWIWGLTANSSWEQTGLPALTVVAVALVPVILMLRAGRGDDGEAKLEQVLGEPAAVT
jgi:iron(III) transport system permease protein